MLAIGVLLEWVEGVPACVPDSTQRMHDIQHQQVMAKVMPHYDSSLENILHPRLNHMKRRGSNQIVTPDAAEVSPIVCDRCQGGHIGVIEDVSMVVDNGAPPQHGDGAFGSRAHHFTVYGNAVPHAGVRSSNQGGRVGVWYTL